MAASRVLAQSQPTAGQVDGRMGKWMTDAMLMIRKWRLMDCRLVKVEGRKTTEYRGMGRD